MTAFFNVYFQRLIIHGESVLVYLKSFFFPQRALLFYVFMLWSLFSFTSLSMVGANGKMAKTNGFLP